MFKPKLVKALLAITEGMLNLARPQLECMEVRDGILTVTDGRRLYQIPAKDEINGLYHHNEIEVATKVATAKKTKVQISAGEQKDLQYPECDKLFPSIQGRVKVLLGAHYLKELCELAIAGHNEPFIEFYIEEENRFSEKPVVVQFKTSDTDVARGLIMPVKHEGGSWQYQGRQSQTVLTTGKIGPTKKKVAAV
jgi:hypothetical protein